MIGAGFSRQNPDSRYVSQGCYQGLVSAITWWNDTGVDVVVATNLNHGACDL